jgi:F-type H+-transporting ATPase subunit epsilon
MNEHIPLALKLKVITSHKILADEEVQEVTLPGLNGYLGILPGHRPCLVELGKGDISYKFSGKKISFPVEGGNAEILPDRVLVFTEKSKDKLVKKQDERK